MRHWALILGFLPQLAGQISVSLEPSVPSPASVGDIVTWTATASGSAPGTLWYRFRARRIGEDFHVIRDYGPLPTLEWTESEHEGVFEIEVAVRYRGAPETVMAKAAYEMLSRVNGGAPAIAPTGNPLVFLYSAPPCPAESRMRVEFRSPEGMVQRTPYKPCRAGLSMNFYLAGMRAETVYQVHHTVDSGDAFADGPPLTLTTGRLALRLPAMDVIERHPPQAIYGVLVQAALFTNPIATDLEGNVLWYYPQVLNFMTEPVAGGRFMGIVEDGTSDLSRQVIREFDLAGVTRRETNVARVNEQLAAMGKPPVNAFHHEARRLPDGRILTLAGLERILTDVQGEGPVDVLGEMIVVLSPELEVVWTWDAFEHLDASRKAVLGETCTPATCAPIYLAPRANDWLHANSVEQTPDGNLLLSIRHLDWLIKIDYENGSGSGDVIWRLGKDGDFRFESNDPYPWFSHQHDAGYISGSRIAVFDNGNTRRLEDPAAHSRGQVIELDEENRVARLVVNADLGMFSAALGAAQELPNGNYHFGCGLLPDLTSESVEIGRDGEVIYALHTAAPEYRSYRMRDLYSVP